MKGGDKVTMSRKIKTAVAYRGMSLSALARALEMSSQNFSFIINKGTVTNELMQKICKILEVKHHCIISATKFYSYFEFPDGMRIGDSPKK